MVVTSGDKYMLLLSVHLRSIGFWLFVVLGICQTGTEVDVTEESRGSVKTLTKMLVFPFFLNQLRFRFFYIVFDHFADVWHFSEFFHCYWPHAENRLHFIFVLEKKLSKMYLKVALFVFSHFTSDNFYIQICPFRSVYTYRQRARISQSHCQSLTLCLWWRCLWCRIGESKWCTVL